MIVSHDLCIAWNCPDDATFVALMQEHCQQRGLSTLQVTPGNLNATLDDLASEQVTVRAFLNRASDTDARFEPIEQRARHENWFRINPRELEIRAADKATMHLEFLTAGLQTPHTLILPPFRDQPHLPALDLDLLGDSFAIKPANGGGGEGVVVAATTLQQIARARQALPNDKYLLQAHIEPVQLSQRPAWFRVLYCTGCIYPSWWHARDKIYRPVTRDEEERYKLGSLHRVTHAIARVSHLHLFSTEIALTPQGLFVVVDYVNDQIDLRLQSRAVDGVPDWIAQDIVKRLVDLVESSFKDPCERTD